MTARLQLGFDNYSLRSLGWKAPQLIDYAASLKLDVLLLSDPDVFEKHDPHHLSELRRRATDSGILLQAGMLGICTSSTMFDARRGTAEEQLRQTIRIAQGVGSPIARCVLGIIHDRSSAGGIEARIAETVAVLRSVRSFALDQGVKIAVENHAGDMQARELVMLIEAAGKDFVGALVDAGNATWALDEPVRNLECLAPYALSTGIRDSALWETESGAMLEWTAIGTGNVDWHAYFKRFSELCPQVPVVVETIPARRFDLPYLRREFWQTYPEARAEDFAAFIGLVKRGKPPAILVSQAELDGRADDPSVQRACLETSLRFCREVLGLGRK